MNKASSLTIHPRFIAVRHTASNTRWVEEVDELAITGTNRERMRKYFGRRAVRVVGVVLLFAIVVVLLFLVLDWYIAPTKPSQRKDLILALAQILGGAALISGLYFTARTLQVNREGQITDRFTRAIDQLGDTDEDGNKRLEIRIGGIYALERIAKESKEDYWPIMEILTAYVRQNAHWPEEKSEEFVTILEAACEGKAEYPDTATPEPDIQAIMNVLRRRHRYFGHGEPEPIDLHETDLRGVDLSEANLHEAFLYRANLHGASFSKADLSGATLVLTIPQGTNLIGTNLSGASFSGAFLLSRASLSGLDGADYFTVERLRQAKSLEGTTMPDGKTLKSNDNPYGPTFEEWLKAREDRQEND